MREGGRRVEYEESAGETGGQTSESVTGLVCLWFADEQVLYGHGGTRAAVEAHK